MQAAEATLPQGKSISARLPGSGNGAVPASLPPTPQLVDQPGDELLPSRGAEGDLAAAWQLSPVPMLILEGAGGRIQDANRAALELLGYASQEITHLAWRDLLPPDCAEFHLPLAGHMEAGALLSTAAGELRPLDLCVTGLASGTLLLTLQCAAARLRLEQDLGVIQQRYRAIVEDQTEMILRWQPDGRMLFANGAFRRARGLALDDALEGLEALYCLAGAVHRPADAAEPLTLPALTPESPIRVRELRRESPEGQVTWERWLDRGFFTEGGELCELQSVGKDTTSRKLLERIMEKERASLAEKVEKRTAALAAANSEIARLCKLKDDHLAEVISHLRQHLPELGDRGQAMLTDLQEAAELEAGRIQAEDAPFDAARLFRECMASRGDQLNWQDELPPHPLPAVGDAPRLRRVWTHLLDAMLELYPDLGGLGLGAGVSDRGRTLEAWIWAGGLELSQKQMRQLFRPFSPSPSHGSSGEVSTAPLGLFLASCLAAAQGGSVTAGPRGAEGGLHVRMRLPLARPGTGLPTPQRTQRISPTALGRTILLAARKSAFTLAHARMLEGEGYRVLRAETGVEAVTLAHQDNVDLLLCDAGVAMLDGWATVQSLRSAFALGALPVILLQDLALPGDRERAEQLGIHTLHPRPLHEAELPALVQSALD